MPLFALAAVFWFHGAGWFLARTLESKEPELVATTSLFAVGLTLEAAIALLAEVRDRK